MSRLNLRAIELRRTVAVKALEAAFMHGAATRLDVLPSLPQALAFTWLTAFVAAADDAGRRAVCAVAPSYRAQLEAARTACLDVVAELSGVVDEAARWGKRATKGRDAAA
jgi:hypothetical protein